jgi:GAF domain-containing protein/anti-sigma regulatory factor (Ser/Thr protein kinase)
VISADKNYAHAFSTNGYIAVQAIAAQTTISLQNSRMLEAKQRRADALSNLQKTSTQMRSSFDMKSVLKSIVNSAIDLVSADSATLFTFDEETCSFVEAFRGGNIKTQPTHPGSYGFWAKFIMDQQPEFIGTVRESQVIRISSFVEREHIQAIAAIPLRFQKRPRGLLFVNYLNEHDFSPEEKELLLLLADQAAVAINNTRIFEQRKEDIATLHTINKAISDNNFANIPELIAQHGTKLTRADACELWLEREGHLELAGVFPKKEAPATADRYLQIDERSINGWVYKTKRPYNSIKDISLDPHYKIVREGILSNMAVPLKLGERYIGTLSVESRKVGTFGKYEVELLQTLADQAVLSIEIARLFRRNLDEISQLEKLQNITKASLENPTDITTVLTLIVQHIQDIFPKSNCAIRLYDSSQSSFGQKVAVGALIDIWFKPRQNGATQYILQRKSPLFIDSATQLKKSRRPDIRPEFKEKGIRSIAYYPLISDGKVIGFLYLNLCQEHTFTQNERVLLDILSGQAVTVIRNAILYGEVAETWGGFIREHYAMDLVHSLNNKLGTIPARIGLIQENLMNPRKQELVYKHLEGAAEDARKVMREAKSLQEPPSPQDITEMKIIFQAIAEEVFVSSQGKIKPEIRYPENLPPIHTIRINLIYAIRSIVDNAVESLPSQGGRILIIVRLGKNHAKDPFMEIRISDNGLEIPENIQKSIFQAGFTTKQEGSGYGLWRARKLIESLKGTLVLERPQHGELVKTFVIRIPLTQDMEQ